MALPAVAAQFVNLLYAIVDRVYIGHIPGIGTDALAGVGVTMSIVILISSFSAIVGAGGAPLAAIALGAGKPGTGRKDIREWICPAFAFYGCDFFTGVSVYGTRAVADGSFGTYSGICGGLSVCLFAGHLVCRAFSGG